MVQKVASMEISLQPFVQGKGHSRRSLCWDTLMRQWSIAIVFLWHPLPHRVSPMYTSDVQLLDWLQVRQLLCVSIHLNSNSAFLREPGKLVINSSLSLSHCPGGRWRGEEMVWLPLSQQSDGIQLVAKRGFHRDLGDNTPFGCCFSWGTGGKCAFSIVWDGLVWLKLSLSVWIKKTPPVSTYMKKSLSKWLYERGR